MQSIWYQLGEWIAGLLHLPAQAVGQPLGIFIGAFVVLNLIMGVVTYMIWWLRKLVGFMQSRYGPKHVGWHGLMQTPADALKLMSKEGIIPTLADRTMFIVAPAIVFISAYLVYATIPFAPNVYIADLNVGVIYASAVASITVVGIVLGAWSSNNKYALVSAFRSAAQLVSYEVPFALAVVAPVMLAGSFSFIDIVQGPYSQAGFASGGTAWSSQLFASVGLHVYTGFWDWFIITQPIIFFCFFVAGLAENNVTPFDIVEAESEIVAGFHVEYSGMKFALFFLAEFANTMTLAILTTLLFLGGWTSPVADNRAVEAFGGAGSLLATLWHLGWFGLKTGLLITTVFWLRATLPRVRVDQLMDIGWKWLIPLTLFNMMVTGAAVSLGMPRMYLAALNWAVLLLALALGARKPMPSADKSRGVGVMPASAPTTEVRA
jgi:NADH-quinone oxidoreductase subunit H